ncbi:MAG: hypothetical protein ACO2ZZ_13145, partial [Cyclobacteriaceae bacterium]
WLVDLGRRPVVVCAQGQAVSSQGEFGTGFTLGSLSAVGRALDENGTSITEWESFINGGASTLGEREDIGNNLTVIGTVNNYGQTDDFTATPTVTVNGNNAGDTDARIDAELTWSMGTLNLTASDAGRYSDGASLQIQLLLIGTFQGQSDTDTIGYLIATETASNPGGEVAAQTYDLNSLAREAQYQDEGAFVAQGIVDNLGAATIEATHNFYISSVVAAVVLEAGTDNETGTAAAGSVTGANGDNLIYDVENAGEGYHVAPTFTFSGYSINPSWIIHEFPVRYQFNISDAGSGYTFVPDDIDFEARAFVNDVNTTHTIEYEDVTGYQSDSTALISRDFADMLTVNAGGYTPQNDSVAYFVTNLFLHGAPYMVALTPGEPIEIANTNLAGDGSLNSFEIAAAGSGYVSAPVISFVHRTLVANPDSLDLSATAMVDLSTYLGSVETNERSKQITWSITNGTFIFPGADDDGLGYTNNINDTSTGNISDADARVSYSNLEPGDIVYFNIDYGYGTRESEPTGDDNANIVYYN